MGLIGIVTFGVQLLRISPFRWRQEWLMLVAIAASLVISEQAREAQEREPAAFLRRGEPVRALVLAARDVPLTVRIARGESQQVVKTYVDLEWRDIEGTTRRVENFHIPAEVAADVGVDAQRKRWPEFLQILYLIQPVGTLQTAGANAEAVGVHQTAGPPCRPLKHCALTVLDTRGWSSAHEELERIALAMTYAPLILWLSLAAFVVSLGLRLAGIIDNKPSLE